MRRAMSPRSPRRSPSRPQQQPCALRRACHTDGHRQQSRRGQRDGDMGTANGQRLPARGRDGQGYWHRTNARRPAGAGHGQLHDRHDGRLRVLHGQRRDQHDHAPRRHGAEWGDAGEHRAVVRPPRRRWRLSTLAPGLPAGTYNISLFVPGVGVRTISGVVVTATTTTTLTIAPLP